MDVRIEFSSSDDVGAALSRLGRTEDIKFSPDNRRLAIAGFAKDRCLVIDFQIDTSATRKAIRLTDFIEITSPSFDRPHGVAFIDRHTLIVANRGGLVPILQLPADGLHGRCIEAPVLQTIRRTPFGRLKSPGSVTVSPIDDGRFDVLVCNNFQDRVTRHVLDGHPAFQVIRNKMLLRRKLHVPDGLAVSRDRRWIAVSNHEKHNVLVFENAPKLGPFSMPCGVLQNVSYPHGLCFAGDDRFVIVADAGIPFLHVFGRDETGWRGRRDPVASIKVMDDATFLRGRQNPKEGGPKGLDVDGDMQVVAMTSEFQPLTFFDLPALLNAVRAQAAAE